MYQDKVWARLKVVEGGERINRHKKAAAFIETCYWRAKITLNNNNPPPWKPINSDNKRLACLQLR